MLTVTEEKRSKLILKTVSVGASKAVCHVQSPVNRHIKRHGEVYRMKRNALLTVGVDINTHIRGLIRKDCFHNRILTLVTEGRGVVLSQHLRVSAVSIVDEFRNCIRIAYVYVMTVITGVVHGVRSLVSGLCAERKAKQVLVRIVNERNGLALITGVINNCFPPVRWLQYRRIRSLSETANDPGSSDISAHMCHRVRTETCYVRFLTDGYSLFSFPLFLLEFTEFAVSYGLQPYRVFRYFWR